MCVWILTQCHDKGNNYDFVTIMTTSSEIKVLLLIELLTTQHSVVRDKIKAWTVTDTAV